MTTRNRVFPPGHTHVRTRLHVISRPAPRRKSKGRLRPAPADAPLIMKGAGYVPGLPIDWTTGKTICFLTRCHPQRPNMQKVCFDSVKNQTCDDYQHFLIQGPMRESDGQSRGDGKFAVEHGLTKPWPIDAHYVMVLDDDNMLVDMDFVKDLRNWRRQRIQTSSFSRPRSRVGEYIPRGPRLRFPVRSIGFVSP